MLTTIGFIQDKFSTKYEVKYWSRKNHDRTHYDMAAYDRSNGNQVGEFEFDVYDGEFYAYIDVVNIESEYQSKGIYIALLNFAKVYFVKHGLKGIYSEGKLRNSSAEKAWDKIPNKSVKDVEFDSKHYKDYTLEHLTTFELFEKENEYTVFDNKHGAKFWGDEAAGILPICKSTGRILISFRSEQVNEPHTWGTFGGKMDKGETPVQAAERELLEETGYVGKYELIEAYIFVAPGNKFKYHNFIGIVEEEFDPHYDWETEDSKWMTLKELIDLQQKHFGLKKLLEKSMNIIQKFAK